MTQFDVVGFSLGYELIYTNLLNILDLGRIPLFSKERGEKDPFVIAGGPSVYNPEPVADYVDVFIIGDGESSIIEFLNKILLLKDKPRNIMLASLNQFTFTYVPSLYQTKRYKGYLLTNIDKIVRRKIL